MPMPTPMPMTPDSKPVMAHWAGVAGNGESVYQHEGGLGVTAPYLLRTCLSRLQLQPAPPDLARLSCLVCLPPVLYSTKPGLLFFISYEIAFCLLFTIPILPVCESPRAPDAPRPCCPCCWCCYFRLDNLLVPT